MEQNGTPPATLAEFTYFSQVVAGFLRSFGDPEHLKHNLETIAIWGPNSELLIEPWADRVVQVRGYDQPIRIRPWTEAPDRALVGRCANLCGVWMMNLLWTMVFKEKPRFWGAKSNSFEADFFGKVDKFIADHFEELKKRVEFVIEKQNYSEWLALAETMEIERIHLMKEVEGNSPPKHNLTVNQTACFAILDGHKIELRPNQAKALALLISRDGEFASLADNDLRSRDIDALPLALKELVETQPGAGTRILRDKVEWLS